MKIKHFILSLILLLLMISSAMAGSLQTSMLPTGEHYIMTCNIVNIGDRDIVLNSGNQIDADGIPILGWNDGDTIPGNFPTNAKYDELKCTGYEFQFPGDYWPGDEYGNLEPPIVIPPGGSCTRYTSYYLGDAKGVRCEWGFIGSPQDVRSVLMVEDHLEGKRFMVEGR